MVVYGRSFFISLLDLLNLLKIYGRLWSFFQDLWSRFMVFRSGFFSLRLAELWSKAGHFNISQAKHSSPVKTTTWIWNLHSDAHDFCISSMRLITRKIFSSNVAHLSLVFFWLSGMHFHGAYFANVGAWNKDPKHCLPSAQTVCALVGEDILNSDVGCYFQGIYITSGFFQLWRSEGIVTEIHLKYACTAALIGTISCMGGAYFHMHSTNRTLTSTSLRVVNPLSLLLGLGSMSWSGHHIHISLPVNRLLDSGVDPAVIPWPQDLLFVPKYSSSDPYLLFTSTPSFCIGTLAAHHFYLALVCISSGLNAYTSSNDRVRSHAITSSDRVRLLSLNGSSSSYMNSCSSNSSSSSYTSSCSLSPNGQLSLHLLIAGSSSIVFGHHVYAIPVYPYLASDYPTVLSLFCHHINIGVALTVGSAAHASIKLIRDSTSFTTQNLCQEENYYLVEVLNHRCIIIGHLIYVSIALGFHSFGLYIHNDTLQSLSRTEDMFADNAIQLKPVFAMHEQELSTADFLVHHIHAFTIHVTLLVLLKGVLYGRTSRLVSDKLELGFRYPCDGPGRGGTCQISPYDHLYLAIFWAYNSLSVVLFHYSWKMQSDVWGTLSDAPTFICSYSID
jgi:photosystem I P700 chlorophyll a apoprotein A1